MPKKATMAAKKKGFEALMELKESAAKRSSGAWWWRFLTPVHDEQQKKTFLKCEVCSKNLSASSPCKTAEEHLKRFHKMTEEVEGDTKMSMEEVRELVRERQLASSLKGKKRRKKDQPASENRPRKSQHVVSNCEQMDSREHGVNTVGIPGQCRRPCHTKTFLVSKFQEDCSDLASQLRAFLKGLPPAPSLIDIDVSGLEFHAQFERCAAEVDVGKVDLNTTKILKRQTNHHHYYDRNPEEVGRATCDGRSKDETENGTSLWENEEDWLTGDSWFAEDKLYMDVVENSAQRYASREDCRQQRDLPSSSGQEHPWGETLKKVHGCMEVMSSKLACVNDMMVAWNIGTNGMYRKGLGRVYLAIARYLEDVNGRDAEFYYHQNRTFVPTIRHDFEDLSQKESCLVDDIIAKFEKHIAKQYKLLEEGKPLVCKTLIKARKQLPSLEEEAEISPGGDINGGSNISAGLDEMSSPRAPPGLTPNHDVVVLVRLHHPLLLKTRVIEVLAAGHHTLEEVLNCLKCTVLHHMSNLNEKTSSSYLFLDGVFYKRLPTPDSEDYTKNIRDFCEAHNCGWPLDPDRAHHSSYIDGDVNSCMSDLVLRISNKPLGIYCHHGSCEHLVQIVDVRLLHPTDPPQLNRGPVIVKNCQGRIRMCSLCRKAAATLMAYGDQLSVSNPCFYCEDCHKCLHYDEKGELLVEPFVLLPYYRE